jgi:hypothetical protein
VLLLLLPLLQQAHWHGKVLLEHELNVVVAPLKAPAAAGGGGAVDASGVGDLDDGDFKLNTQVRTDLISADVDHAVSLLLYVCG